jgi:hypothetical protein
MNKILITLGIVLLNLNISLAQKYMDDITQKSCECIENMSLKGKKDQISAQLGVCMIQASMPYKKQLKKDHDIDLEKMGDEEGRKLGTIIGFKLAGVCPESLIKISQLMNNTVDEIIVEELEEDEFKKDSKQLKGKITNIEKDLFVVITIEETNGKTTKLLWLNFVQSNIDLPIKWESLVGKNVSINYNSNAQFFDPKINDYRIFLIIDKLNVE